MYVITCVDGSYYCGITTDIDRRIDEHNGIKKKGAKYTRSRRPVSLLYEEEHSNRSEASKSESAFKKLSKQQKLQYMSDQVTVRFEKEMKKHQKRSQSE
jgi:putative endonuclease